MIRQITKLISLLLLFVSTSFFSYSQTTTVTFNDIPTTNSANSLNLSDTYDNSGVRFQIFSGSNSSAYVSYTDNGFNNTKALDDNNIAVGGVTGWKITKVDGTAFQLASIWLQNGCAECSASGTIKAFKNGVQVGSTETVTFDSQTTGVKNFASDPNFYNVDEIRIEGVDLYIYIDNFSFGPAIDPVDADPPVVTGISLVGTPLSTATSVSYSVTFSKEAKNVSSDDFQVTTAGTIGTVGAVSGSGSSYTVAVNGIDGEGTIRLDLKGGTNIANIDDNTGTPAFTSGELHYVGACFVETFETETDASTSFSGNGVNFSLGAGFEIEKKGGFGAGGSNGYVRNNNTAGSFSLTSASEFTMSNIDLYLSNTVNSSAPTATGTITITGKKGGIDQYTVTKSSGFPTTTTVNGGFFTINFSTDGAGNYRNINVDELVFTIGGGFIELAIDNMNFCEAAPDVDSQAPGIQSISKIGSPLSTAGTVNFQVTFDEDASNVTLDDFTLLKTGTASGALTGISGSGSIYTLGVTGISGEGSIQIKLNAGTNIQDALGNTPPFEFLNGEVHLVGACYIETFEIGADALRWISNGKEITLGGNWIVRDRNGFGINSSSGFVEERGEGPYVLSVNIPVKFSKLALYLSSEAGGTNPTNDGTLTIRGKNGATTVYAITKNTGFPTDFSSNSGYFYIDFASEGGVDNSATYVDGLEIEIGGSFIYLAMDNLEFCSDFDKPAGYTATIDQDPIREKTANAASFTFADAEIGTTYNYSFSSDGGGNNVTGSGAIATATDQITGIDLSGLGVGTVTLSVTLTDPSGNIGDPATDTKQKIANIVPVTTAPTAPVVIEDETGIPLADDIQVADGDGDDQTLTFTITGGTVTLGTTDITFGGSGNGSASFTAVGTLAALNTALDAATFTPTPGLVGTDAGTIAFVANDGLVDSNTASVTFDIGQKGPTETSLIMVSRSSGDYDGDPFEATGEATGLDRIVLSPSVTFEYEQYDGSTWSGIAGAPTDAGAYRVRSNFAGNDEYIAGSSDWTAFAIDQVNASVTPNAYSKYCGQEDPDDLSGTLAGFISGDNVTATYSINGDVISATLSPVGVLGNYNITYNTAVFSIFDVVIDVSESGTPVPLGSTATLTASIVPAASGVSVQFLLDNVPYGTVLTNNGIATIDVPGLELGVYKITAIVGNDCSESIAYLPIYDSDGNFVTGGGWIMSPRGAYKADESLTGKANFGFLSKYKKGSNQVDGNTEFQFKSGDLYFKSTFHESGTLVISGKKATYRGEGTINGQLGYKFTLVALDGDWNGGSGPDEFRIKIWGNLGIIYDNGMGLDDNSDAAATLGGGSIVIHEAKGKGNKRVVADLVAVPWNTSSEEIEKKISSMSSEWFERKDVKLTINTASYNALQPGFYEFKANLVENERFALEEPITVNVLVVDKPLATDIQLSNTIIQRDIRNGSVIGDLRTIDPVDDQHTYSIATQSDFELVGSSLIWKGTAIPAKARITVFSMDRAGQTIERAIELSREPRFGDFNMFPNPAESDVTLEVELDQTMNVGIKIFDAVGRLVYEEERVQNGNATYQINIDDLSSGMYTVQLITDRLVVNKILIKK